MPLAGDDLVLDSFRGGQNDTDDPLELQANELVSAINVEFFYSACGERRLGCTPLNLVGTFGQIGTQNTICSFINEWYPTSDPKSPEWWVGAGIIGTSFSFLRSSNFGSTWTALGEDDQPSGVVPFIYQVTSQPLNGIVPLFFFAYQTIAGNIDRMHVWDNLSGVIRRSGFLALPSAPGTPVDTGSGSYNTTRYFRVRWLQENGSGQIIRRSEPTNSVQFNPSGSGSGALITQPSAPGERETHWEIEAALDNATFYRIGTLPIATTTFTDTTSAATGYSNGGANPLSDAIGTYLPLPAARFVASDNDRLILGGHFFDPARASSVYWTPVFNDPFPGQFERLPLQKNNSINLDNGDGGPITGISSSINGIWYAFKWKKIYGFVRTYNASIEYTVLTLSTELGALPGSVFEGVDESGTACIYFLDPTQGPCRVGPNGVQIIRGLRKTWKRMNLHANLPAIGLYYPFKRQAKWWVAFDGSDTPNTILNSQVSEHHQTKDGEVSGCWSIHTGPMALAFGVGLYTGVPVTAQVDSLNPRPMVGLRMPYLLNTCDITDFDAGLPYTASMTTKPYLVTGALNKWGVRAAAGIVDPSNVQTLGVTVVRDFGVESLPYTMKLAPQASETQVVADMDDCHMSTTRAIQITFTDGQSNP